MRKIKAAAITATMVGALTLAACSSNGSSGDASAEPDTAGGTAANQLTFMFRGGDYDKLAYEAAIDAFEEETGAEVKMIITDADQYATKLQAAIAGNKVPDVFYIEPGKMMGYVYAGVLADLTDYVGQDVIDNIWSFGTDAYRFNTETGERGNSADALYGLPKDVGPFGFGYNTVLFEKLGLEAPSADEPMTFDEFVALCKELTVDMDGDGELDHWGTGLNVVWNSQAFVWGAGADWISEDQKTVTVDTPEFADALQWFADLGLVEGVTPSVEQAQTLDTYQRWMAGELGFFPVAPWDIATYNEKAETDPENFGYDVIPYPVANEGDDWSTWLGSLGIAVSENSANKELAAQLATYLSTDLEAQKILAENKVQIPNLIDYATGEWIETDAPAAGWPANTKAFLEIAEEKGRPLPGVWTYTPEWYDNFWIGIENVVDNGSQTAADFVAGKQTEMQSLLDQSWIAADQAKVTG
ncbi:sugar ABC transporter substrate-binding protein [Demequina sp. SYSU T00192]|uniref:Sugar ABC transporter substrate-binding protein n=1 Tax=Demequina litoralis TaxID=3051660 RepID=A0ABT8G800_9MICO|nr:sugar ABC transporter substrate-binding protein [Demequina sp. SYSU T00192]MDN4475265.1 sugar ABC transporter substrate-binding protein [Demequina sp. SYSU T00192]